MRVAERGDDPALARDRDQVLVAHELRDRGRHLRREPGRQSASVGAFGGIGQQPVAELADGQRATGAKAARVVGVEDQPGDVVLLVGDDGVRRGTLLSGTSASDSRAATRSLGACRREPRQMSPERSGDAFASSVFRSANVWRVPPIS